MQEFTINNLATIITLFDNLMYIDFYMVKVGGKIQKFNHYIKKLVFKLGAKEHTFRRQDLLIMLLCGFEANLDKNLNLYFICKKDEFEEGVSVGTNTLMTNILNKYSTLVNNSNSNRPNNLDKKIVPLQAKLKQQQNIIKDNKLILSKNLKDKLHGKRQNKDNPRGNKNPKGMDKKAEVIR